MKFDRIYINSRLAENSKLELYDDHVHYIKTALRLRINDKLRVFNGIDGEFIAQIIEVNKNNLLAEIKEYLRKSTLEGSLTLVISIIKQDKLMLAVNMVTQLGVTRIIPIITERCQFRTVNIDRLMRCAIEATEQSERLTPPIIEKAILLQDYLKGSNDSILYANEYEKKENSIPQVLNSFKEEKSKVSVLIGPEGGFTDSEIKLLRSHKNTQSISLGRNILRAETAAVSAIAQVKLFIR